MFEDCGGGSSDGSSIGYLMVLWFMVLEIVEECLLNGVLFGDSIIMFDIGLKKVVLLIEWFEVNESF